MEYDFAAIILAAARVLNNNHHYAHEQRVSLGVLRRFAKTDVERIMDPQRLAGLIIKREVAPRKSHD